MAVDRRKIIELSEELRPGGQKRRGRLMFAALYSLLVALTACLVVASLFTDVMPSLKATIANVATAAAAVVTAASPAPQAALLGSSSSSSSPYVPRPPLTFSPNGTFKVATFSDLHYGEAEDLWWGPAQDRNSTRVMRNVIASEQPSFVVYNGDLITGENTFRANSTSYLDRLVQAAHESRTPWASTYGNHDNDVNISHAALLAREQARFGALSWTSSFFDESRDGASAPANYFVPVYALADRRAAAREAALVQRGGVGSVRPRLLLWFFDSRSGRNATAGGNPDWVSARVAAWVNATAAEMRRGWGGQLPASLAFVHIPTNVSAALQYDVIDAENGSDSGAEDPDRPGLEFPGLNDDSPLASQGAENYQGKPYQGQDQEFLKALGGLEGLAALVSGHDHGCAWCARMGGEAASSSGLNVCFGRHTGYGGYGTWARGSRIFSFQDAALKNGEVASWNRMEDGTVIDSVTLQTQASR